MADVNTGDSGGHHGKHEKKRAKKASTRIDMTPMVDLAFLLLTFFVLTSTFNKAKTMEINYPAKPKTEDEKIKVNNALTFILTREGKDEKEDGIYYYYGEFYPERNKPTIDAIKKLEDQYEKHEIADTTYKRLAVGEKGKKDALTVLIKADDKAVYKNIVDAIDELNICNVGKYAVVDMGQGELNILNAIKKK